RPDAARWRSRCSTKMPLFGSTAYGNNVVSVSTRIGAELADDIGGSLLGTVGRGALRRRRRAAAARALQCAPELRSPVPIAAAHRAIVDRDRATGIGFVRPAHLVESDAARQQRLHRVALE